MSENRRVDCGNHYFIHEGRYVGPGQVVLPASIADDIEQRLEAIAQREQEAVGERETGPMEVTVARIDAEKDNPNKTFMSAAEAAGEVPKGGRRKASAPSDEDDSLEDEADEPENANNAPIPKPKVNVRRNETGAASK